MNSPTLPYLVRSESHEAIESLEALQNLIELIREDIQHPLRIKAYLDQANKLIRTMRRDLY